MSRILSLAALTVLELSQVDRIHAAAEAGFSHVGLRLIAATPQEAHEDLVHDPVRRRAVQQALRSTGVQVLDAEIFRLRPATVLADLEPAIALAAELGARELLVAGHVADEARMADHFAALCERAAAHGLGANLEFMPWTEVPDLACAARVVARAERPNGAVLVDAFHLSRSRSDWGALATLPTARSRYLQLCDAPAALPPTMEGILAEARAERRFPGEGGLPLVALLKTLPPGLPLSIEVPTQTLAREVDGFARARLALAATRRLLAEAGE